MSEHDAATAADHHGLALGNSAAVMATHGPQLVSAPLATDASVTDEQLAKATAFATERADREKRLLAPRFVMPTNGTFTSGFGYRWGALHGGIDIANSIGTPIVAAADGVVIATGPTAGYGAWVKIRHSDGTVTLYGHINTWEVSVGQRVMAGDRIATIGNRVTPPVRTCTSKCCWVARSASTRRVGWPTRASPSLASATDHSFQGRV